jgi:hypothetical protein
VACCAIGGKDSLVVWQMAVSAGKKVHLFYASDGDEELRKNWRLHAIGALADRTTDNPYNIGTALYSDCLYLLSLSHTVFSYSVAPFRLQWSGAHRQVFALPTRPPLGSSCSLRLSAGKKTFYFTHFKKYIYQYVMLRTIILGNYY